MQQATQVQLVQQMAVAVDRGDVGVRIDRVLLRHLSHIPGVTRNRLQRLIDRGHVTVNGVPVLRAAARVGARDSIALELPVRKARSAPAAEEMPLDVRYEDDDLLIVNKPPGQVSHPAFRHSSGTLLNGVMAYARSQWTPALVSRLDRGTSGLVLVAKHKTMFTALQRLGSANGIEKDYLAIVVGKPPARGTIDLALDRDPWDARRVTVRDRGGVPSVTRFERLRWVGLGQVGQVGLVGRVQQVGLVGRVQQVGQVCLSLLRCRLITGRMHQIRVHLAAKGWPIAGDVTYGVKFDGLDRQALHAARLAFQHPASGASIDVAAPPPPDMARVLRLFDPGELREHRAER
jgi:23S rRNA pseudouridine1911/1915/1917 synthase